MYLCTYLCIYVRIYVSGYVSMYVSISVFRIYFIYFIFLGTWGINLESASLPSMEFVTVAHTEEEKFWGCTFQVESLVKSCLPQRAEGALLARKTMDSGYFLEIW